MDTKKPLWAAPGDWSLYQSLPKDISLLPPWLPTSLILTLLGLTVCLTFVHTRQNHGAERVLWFVVASIMTVFMALSLHQLVSSAVQVSSAVSHN